MPEKLTQEEFLKRCYESHGDTYDYSKVRYTTLTQSIKIGCPVHGWYYQNARNHSRGSGCPKCYYVDKDRHRKSKKLGRDM